MIDTSTIRKKILDLALLGRLTSQYDSDSSTEELYINIQKEKLKLINEKKLKKQKDFSSIGDSEIPFEIPKNWKWVRVGQIFTLQAGKNKTASEIEEKAENDKIYPCYGGNGLRGYVNESNVSGKHVLIGRQGALCGNVNFAENEFWATEHAVVVYQYANTNVDWAGFTLRALDLNQYATSVAQPGLAVGTIENVLIPLPPIEEQNRIADKIVATFNILNRIDEFQEAYSQDSEVLKNKLIDAGIQGKLTEQLPEDGTMEELYLGMVEEKKQILKDRKGREDKNIKEVDDDVPYELPANWKWVRFGEIGLFKKGPFGSALTKAMFVPKSEETVKVYEQQHAIQKKINLGSYYITREYFDDKMNGFEVLPGDILISCAGTIGETYILPDEIEQGIINQALMRVSLVPSVNKRFFQYYFDANLKKTAQEESNGSAIKNIPPFDVMKNWYFPLAPLKEQDRIVEKIEEILSFV